MRPPTRRGDIYVTPGKAPTQDRRLARLRFGPPTRKVSGSAISCSALSDTALAKPDERALLAGYDQRRGNRMSVNRLPPVGRIRAVHLPEGGPRVPKSLTIEYSDRSNASK